MKMLLDFALTSKLFYSPFKRIKEYIESALKDHSIATGMSSNHKVDSPLGSLGGSIIFDNMNTLPKEVMLETTLKAFDYSLDFFEVNLNFFVTFV